MAHQSLRSLAVVLVLASCSAVPPTSPSPPSSSGSREVLPSPPSPPSTEGFGGVVPPTPSSSSSASEPSEVVVPPLPSPSSPDDGRLILLQDGIPQLGLTLHRDRLDLSAGDIEAALETTLAFKTQSESCSLGLEESTGIAVILDDDMAALGFVVESDGFRTPGGIGVGSTSEELADVFGGENLVELYDGKSRTGGSVVVAADQDHLEASPGPGSLHYGFDTDGSGIVRRLRAGYWPYVSYPDYCLPAAAENHYPGWPLEDLR